LPAVLDVLRGEQRAPTIQVILDVAGNSRSVNPQISTLEGRNGAGELVTLRPRSP